MEQTAHDDTVGIRDEVFHFYSRPRWLFLISDDMI